MSTYEQVQQTCNENERVYHCGKDFNGIDIWEKRPVQSEQEPVYVYEDPSIYEPETDEYIQSIQYTEQYELNGIVYVGYEIETSEQTMLFLIDNHSNCCEDWGVNASEIVDVIGTKLNKVQFKSRYETGHVRINVVYDTDRLFEIDIWCDHNGYYPHNYYVKWGEFEDNDLI